MSTAHIWLMTGSASGLRRSLAEQVLARGETGVAMARKPEQLDDLVAQYSDQVLVLLLDVTQPEQVQAAVERAIATFG